MSWLDALRAGANQYRDPASGLVYSWLNSSGVGSEGHGDAGLFGDGVYIVGSGEPSTPYRILDAAGNDTGRTGTYAADWSVEALAVSYLAVMAVVYAAGTALAGSVGGSAGAVAAPEAAGGAVPWEAGFEGTGALSGVDAIPGAGLVDAGAISGGATAAGAIPALTETGATLGGLAGTIGRVASSIGAVLGLVSGAGGGAQPQPGGAPQPTPIGQGGDNTAIWLAAGAVALFAMT